MSTPRHEYDNFVPYRDVTGSEIHEFQTITAVQPWARASFEEIRLHAYQNSGVARAQWTSSTSAQSAFNPLGTGMKHARLPFSKGFSPPPPARPFKQLSTEMISFEVGKDKPQTFTVHANIALEASDFVRMALSPGWREASTRTIPLPEDTPEAFKIYLHWLYTHSIFSSGDTLFGTSDYPLLANCYILGQKLLDNIFQDTIIDTILTVLGRTHAFDVTLTNTIYDHTPEKSNLRKLWCDIYAWCGDSAWLDNNGLAEEINAEFLADLAKLQISFWQGQRPPVAPFLKEQCRYHAHGDKPCYRIQQIEMFWAR